jgi:hypothetical protein
MWQGANRGAAGRQLREPMSVHRHAMATWAGFLGLLAAAFAGASAAAAPKAEPWSRWAAHDPSSPLSVDHSAWDRFLAAYVRPSADGVNRVAYARVRAEDRGRLVSYLADLARVPVSRLNRDEQRAFWINLYNALTVKVVLDHFPVKSIKDIGISPGLFSVGPWGKKLVRVEGEDVSLDDVEHRILRPIWRDPRIHYAVNCSALGCPNLQAAAFTAANADALLEQGAKEFVNHPRGCRFEGDRLIVSSIYVWFREDFGDGDDQGVIEHLARYAGPELRARLQGVSRIAGDGYAWQLNEVKE